mgnify:CR=1 FL=1
MKTHARSCSVIDDDAVVTPCLNIPLTSLGYTLFALLGNSNLASLGKVMPESQSLEERLGATKQVTDIVRAKEDAGVGGAEHGVTGVEVGAAGV